MTRACHYGGMPKRRPKGSGTITKLPSGRYRARVRVDGKLVSAPTTFDAKIDAQAWLKAQVAMLDSDTWHYPVKDPHGAGKGVPTLRDYATRWLAERDIKPRTRADYQILLDRHILPPLGDETLTALAPALIRSWHAELAPGKPTTRAHAYGLLRTILHTAVDDDIITANPCRIRGGGSVKRDSVTTIASLPEVEAIAAAMPERLRAMIWLAAWCGLRYGEITELRRSDIDITAQVVRVRRGVVRVGGETIVDTPKSAAGIRNVTIPPHVVTLIADHLDRHVGRDPGALLFPSDYGEHLAPSTFYGWYYPARKAAGRPDLRFHDLRHTQATLAAATGATLAELMGRLGHSTPGAAMRYQHIAADRDRAIAEALSGLAAGDVVAMPSKRRA